MRSSDTSRARERVNAEDANAGREDAPAFVVDGECLICGYRWDDPMHDDEWRVECEEIAADG